uniref:Erm(48) leader peptide 1 n=1 Tax=Staphylococcus xylosus TaxID=1288 RepID=A0A1W7M418_STAXY|nr:Erm(48) leader peptide 1 [Staphylococcus xylosus]
MCTSIAVVDKNAFHLT